MKLTAEQKLNAIRCVLIWNYGYYFKKKTEAKKEHDIFNSACYISRLSALAELLTYFDFNYDILIDAIYRQGE